MLCGFSTAAMVNRSQKIGMSKKWDNDYKCDRLKSNYNCLTVFSNNASNISIKLI